MWRWEKVKAVGKMQNYIKTHIAEPITLKALADAAGYSPWYAARLFKELTGRAPFEYLRSMRLSHAAEKLSGGGCKVVDVAFDFVFGSHEGFTRAFTKEFGVTPKQCARSKPAFKLFIPPEFRELYLRIMKGDIDMSEKSNTVFVQVVERPKRKLILKRGIKAKHYFEYCEEVGCDVWEVLSGIKEALYEPIGMWLPEGMRRAGTSEYAQGVEIPEDFIGSVPDGCEVISLPPCSMMVFQGPPFDDEKFEEAIGQLWQVMESYDPSLYGFQWADEDGPRFQLSPMGYRGYIEARPVRAIKNK